MSRYEFTPQAIEDLFEIWSYIANDDSEAASRVEEAIYAACAFLADTPLAGRIRGRLDFLAVALLARATLPELLDCVPSGDKTNRGHSNHSHGAKYSAGIELKAAEGSKRKSAHTFSKALVFVVKAEKPRTVTSRRFYFDDVRRNSLYALVPTHLDRPVAPKLRH